MKSSPNTRCSPESVINRLCDHGPVPVPSGTLFSGYNRMTRRDLGVGPAVIHGEKGKAAAQHPREQLMVQEAGIQGGGHRGMRNEGNMEQSKQRALKEAVTGTEDGDLWRQQSF